MLFFHRPELTVRYASRGLALAAPGRDRLLNACEPGERRRLQRYLAKSSTHEPAWLVEWQKMPGDALQPDEVVATLSCDGVLVELACARHGVLAEWLVTRGTQVAMGTRLALLERQAKAAPALPPDALLRQFVARQRHDAETIATLHGQLAALQDRLNAGSVSATDIKFKRLKHELSKHFHPDAPSFGTAERELRKRLFQEFWPIVEEIDRS